MIAATSGDSSPLMIHASVRGLAVYLANFASLLILSTQPVVRPLRPAFCRPISRSVDEPHAPR